MILEWSSANKVRTLPPQVGFNNNVKHRGRVFHIQTEDSGVSRPHITTHLFVDGGVVVKSKRTDYSDDLDEPDLVNLLRKRMKDQHKGMFIALREGLLDRLIDEVLGITQEENVGAPVPDDETTCPAPGTPHPAASEPSVARSLSSARKSLSQMPGRRRSRPPSLQARPRDPTASGVNDAVLKATGVVSAYQDGSSALIPLTVQARTGGIVPLSPRPPSASNVPTAVPGRPHAAAENKGSAPSGPGVGSHPGGRYGATRPSAGFGSPDPSSIFGGSQISEQSLDDVILSYISEDLEGPAREKE